MIFNSEIDFGDLITISNGGIKCAEYYEIVNMLTRRYKEVYGDDINLDITTADGIWIHNIAMLINNILQGYQELYANLSINSSGGVFLDKLCALSNVYRKAGSNSIAKVTIENIGVSDIVLDNRTISCIDKSGRVWSSNKFSQLTLSPNDTIDINVICEEVGPIEAQIGDIYQVVDLATNELLSVTQLAAAEVGTLQETDSELRARRSQVNSPTAQTVLESLQGALLQLAGVKDCLIINNPNNTDSDPYSDNTVIGPHSIYVIIRGYSNLNDLNKQEIGQTLFNKLTPGITTQHPGTESGGTWTDPLKGTTAESEVMPTILSWSDSSYTQTLYWKDAVGDHPAIAIQLQKNAYYSVDEADIIKSKLVDWLNDLQLGTDLLKTDISMKLLEIDPTFKGLPTYKIKSITITGANGDGDYINKLTFYNYSTSDITITYYTPEE